MIESIYSFLESIGFTHPLHPLLVHVPMGLVVGAVAFSLAGLIWTGKHFEQSAYHCSALAFISVFPVILAGYLDWQHVFAGDWSIWIKIKMILAPTLAVALAFALFQKHRGASNKQLFLIYLVCLTICGGLGYSGGELLYGG